MDNGTENTSSNQCDCKGQTWVGWGRPATDSSTANYSYTCDNTHNLGKPPIERTRISLKKSPLTSYAPAAYCSYTTTTTTTTTTIPVEIWFCIIKYIPFYDVPTLMAQTITCQWLRHALLNANHLIQPRLCVDLTPFASILDDSLLDTLVTKNFQILDIPQSSHLGWIRGLNLSQSKMHDLNRVMMNSPCQHRPRLVGLRSLDMSCTRYYFPTQQLSFSTMKHTAWMRQLRSLSLAQTTGCHDSVIHALMCVSPYLLYLDLSYCNYVSDSGIYCLLTAISRRSYPLIQLKLTGCPLIEGKRWASLPVNVAQLWLNLTSFSTDTLVVLIHCRLPVLEYVNIRACPFVDINQLCWSSSAISNL